MVSDRRRAARCRYCVSALRSAFLLWLEDDGRCLGVIRTILESTAQLRAWRLKRASAERLDGRGETTTTRDWLEAAGWRRLSALVRALGELAHVLPHSRWSGAFDVLSELEESQFHGTPVTATTTRGDNLNRSVQLLALETSEHIRLISPELARSTDMLIRPAGLSESDLDRWLSRAFTFRERDLGAPMFRAATEEDYPRPRE